MNWDNVLIVKPASQLPTAAATVRRGTHLEHKVNWRRKKKRISLWIWELLKENRAWSSEDAMAYMEWW